MLTNMLNEYEANLNLLEMTSEDLLRESTLQVQKALQTVNRLKVKTSSGAGESACEAPGKPFFLNLP